MGFGFGGVTTCGGVTGSEGVGLFPVEAADTDTVGSGITGSVSGMATASLLALSLARRPLSGKQRIFGNLILSSSRHRWWYNNWLLGSWQSF